jgi:hypothetical protein
MRYINPVQDLTQNALFDTETLDSCSWWVTDLTDAARRQLDEGFEGVFRRSLLKLMPVEQVGARFSGTTGRPTKELHSMAALMLIMEFRDWTVEDAVRAYTFDNSIHFALNLPNRHNYLCTRTLEGYRQQAQHDELTLEIFEQVTSTLAKELNLDISRQRLDSTMVLSNMAQFTRTKLLGVGIKRLLVSIKRHCPEDYQALPSEMRERYEVTQARLFGEASKTTEGRAQAQLQSAQDMLLLIDTFANHRDICQRTTYQALVKLFNEHCEIKGKDVVVRPHSQDANGQSSHTIQNPSDPGAGYDGHKGQGRKTHLAQTSAKENDVQLITACVTQSAGNHDKHGLEPVLEQQQRQGLLPEEVTADTHYGSDANCQLAEAVGVKVISPVGGRAPSDGQASEQSKDAQRPADEPAKKFGRRQAPAEPSAEQQASIRNAKRRAEQETAEWREKYRRRAGIEGVNRALDAKTGLKKLRVRGDEAVNHAVLGRVAGWNVHQAARAYKMRAIEARKLAKAAQKAAAEAARRFKSWIWGIWQPVGLAVAEVLASNSALLSVLKRPHSPAAH